MTGADGLPGELIEQILEAEDGTILAALVEGLAVISRTEDAG